MSQLPRRTPVAEWAVTWLLLFGTTSLVQAFVIPTGSMEGNLLIGDHLLVDKLAYAPAGPIDRHLLPYTSVKRGDIIVFRYPGDIKLTYVKPVIGLPGDRLQMNNKQVFLNGRPIDEPYKVHQSAEVLPSRDSFPEIAVPAGHYFALGDNRDNSADSRVWGFVPAITLSVNHCASTGPMTRPPPVMKASRWITFSIWLRTSLRRPVGTGHSNSSAATRSETSRC